MTKMRNKVREAQKAGRDTPEQIASWITTNYGTIVSADTIARALSGRKA